MIIVTHAHFELASAWFCWVTPVTSRVRTQMSWHQLTPSRLLHAPGTSLYLMVPKHFRTIWIRLERSHLLRDSWGLLSWWHRQQTTTPDTNEKSFAWTPHEGYIISTHIIETLLGSSLNHFVRRKLRSIFNVTTCIRCNFKMAAIQNES